MKTISVLTLLAFTLCTGKALPQTPQTTHREFKAVRVTSPPKIDGKLDDECWKSLPSSSGFTDETLGTPVKDDTTVWIGYDDKNIYVALYCHDHEPKKIIARETKRGTDFNGEDQVRFRLNPFNSKRGEDESEITLNALGTQFAEFAGGRAVKQEWEGVWQSAARIVDDGWTVEIAIPWRLFVRPPASGQPVTLGINFDRYQARTQIASYWSNLGTQERRELGGQWVGVILPPGDKTNPLSILGYAYGGYDRNRAKATAGLDARYQFTPSLTGVGTINPDFSNVEGAVTSIDFSYAERLPAERRPFFLEGGALFRSSVFEIRPFATVRVPQFDVGGKFYGRIGKGTDIGVLSAERFSGRNDSAITLRQQISPFDSIGIQAVSRIQSGVDNQIIVGSGRFRRGDWQLFTAYGKSFDLTGTGEFGSAQFFWLSKAWSAGVTAQMESPKLKARDGFVPFPDQKGLSPFLGYSTEWRTGPIRSFGWAAESYRFTRMNGTFFRDGHDLSIGIRTDRQLSIQAAYAEGRFEENHDRVYTVGLGYPVLNKFQNYGFNLNWGRQDSADYSALSPYVNWRFFNRLSIGASSEIIHLRGSNEQDVLTVSYDLSRDQGIGGRLVRHDKHTNWYLSFRRSGYGGTEYFLILGDPNSESFSRRLVFKVVRAF